VLPAEKVQTFLDNLQTPRSQDKPLSAWLTHTLKKGEKLDSVASRFGLSTARLKQLNGINARTKVVPGFALLVPGKDAAGHESLAARLPQTPTNPPKATKWKKGKAGAKPRGKGVTVKIRKPAAKPAVKPKKR
jgi:membrane-bound lytic murein transglycosylase D